MAIRLKYWLPASVIALFLLAGCSDPGPAEQTGERIDATVEEVEAAVQEAQDAIDPPGPGERAGRALDDAAEDIRERVE